MAVFLLGQREPRIQGWVLVDLRRVEKAAGEALKPGRVEKAAEACQLLAQTVSRQLSAIYVGLLAPCPSLAQALLAQLPALP